MSGMASRLAGLDKLRRRLSEMMEAGGASLADASSAAAGPLTSVAGFGSNPGNLRMFTYVPPGVLPKPALVVVLHGCTQDAAGYDSGAGWSTLADRHGFVLLLPQQTRTNNPQACFNWFTSADTARGAGEALSIRQMVEHATSEHGIDPARVFVTGLSAGGAMATVMLATYPEVFAAGAIVAGLPYGAARNVQEALDAMFQGRSRTEREWGDLVRTASAPYRGPWPRVSIWHGDADATVKPMNAGETAKQWADVHGLSATPSRRDRLDGQAREIWRDADGREAIESITVAGLAHGTPLSTGPGANQCGKAGPFLIEAGISSTWHIARFFGLTADTALKVAGPEKLAAAHRAPGPDASFERAGRHVGGSLPIDVGAVISKALHAAGLMRRGP